MASISDLIDKAIELAKAAAPLVPALGAGAEIAEKITGIIDDLGDDIPQDKQEEAQQARAKLADAVRAKAAATSDRLRG